MTQGLGGSGITEELYRYICASIPPGSTVLELGSGDGSTQHLGQIYRMYSIEDKIEWIGRHKSVYIFAPLVDNWYDLSSLKQELPKIETYDLILVDGPTGEWNRHGFLNNRLLFNQQVPVIFDDTNRKGEFNLASSYAATTCRPVSWFNSFAVIPTAAVR